MRVMINLIRAALIGVWGVVLAVGLGLYFDDSNPPQIMGGYAPWTVSDSAMAPSYYKGDLAVMNRKRQAQPGDAVLVQAEGGLLFRRIIGTTEDQYILKGDGGEESFLAGAQSITGVCVAYLPGCGAAAEFLYSLPGIAVVCVVGLALFILPGRMTRKTRKKSSRRVQPVQAAGPDQLPSRERPERRQERPIRTQERPERTAERPGRNRYTPRH